MYKPIDADVIIIGAGLSGLTAAYHLLKKEPYLNILILESSEKIGGRILLTPLAVKNGTSHSKFNVGGQWVCREQNQLLDLIDELDIPVINNLIDEPSKIIVKYNGVNMVQRKSNILNFLSTSEKIQLTRFILKVEILCRNIKEGTELKWIDELRNTSLKTFIQETVNSHTVELVIEFMIFLTCGVRTSQVSTLFYIFFCISTKGIIHQLLTEKSNLYEFKIKNITTNICEEIAKKIGTEHILTGENVLEVKCAENNAEIVTNRTSYCCYNVIIAIPPPDILKIKFTPDLPQSKYDSISDICSDVITSFIATYPKEFWRDKGFSGEIYNFEKEYSEGPVDFCCNISELDVPALYGLLFSEEITDPNRPIYKKHVLRQLSEYFGREALYPTDYYERSWFNCSSRMFCWKKGTTNFVPNIEQINSRIHWAGAETSNEWYGQLAGAVNSGVRAALEVLYDLRPAALTSDDLMFLRPARRDMKKPLKTYKHPIYTTIVNWKKLIPLGFLIILIIYELKKYLNK